MFKQIIPRQLKDIVKNYMLKNVMKESFYSDRIISRYLRDNYATLSFSQEGEDLLLKRCIGEKESGFYIDIGAHHPQRFSNTYLFYLLNWKGINIDAMPGSMHLFNELRPRDTNLEMAISDSEETLTYYQFNEPALNTFSEKEAQSKNGVNGFNIVNTVQIQTKTLEHVLESFLPENQAIDFMSIDVEGLDLNVLKSNAWDKYRPNYILIENLNVSINSVFESPIYLFLKQKDYTLVSKLGNTMFFINQLM